MLFAEIIRRPKPLIMGILNVTPDSFSDGGLFSETESALRHALYMVEQGAEIIDVGGESTRPGSLPTGADEQIARIVPVIQGLRNRLPGNTLISIDTSLEEVAEAGLRAGAKLINDISAGRGNYSAVESTPCDDREKNSTKGGSGMFSLAAEWGVPIVLMHMQGMPRTMQDKPQYEDVVEDVLGFLLERAAVAQVAGVPRKHIILDPGIGFGKLKDDNLALLANLDRFVATGYAILLGTSRKRFMGMVCNETRPTELVAATVASTALGVMAGVNLFRVHDVRENRQAVDVAHAIKLAKGLEPTIIQRDCC